MKPPIEFRAKPERKVAKVQKIPPAKVEVIERVKVGPVSAATVLPPEPVPPPSSDEVTRIMQRYKREKEKTRLRVQRYRERKKAEKVAAP